MSTQGSGKPLVLLLTAGMGAGHDQVGRELANRLDVYGVRAELVDAGELLPPGWGTALTGLYKFMASRAQWLYELTFQLQMRPYRPEGASVGPMNAAGRKRLAALVRDRRPAIVLSTFHLCSQIAGDMRMRHLLPTPVVSLVLDFYVHGMWAHPGVDAHMLLHDVQVPQVLRRGGRSPVVCGPVVRPAFAGAGTWSRAAARESLGLPPGARAALVVAGSWGVGQVSGTVDVLLEAQHGFVPVVVAGHNDALARSLADRCRSVPGAQVHGWVDDMERLVAASDVVIENAGGLSAMEAMAAGVPVISYAPIAGHGRANAEQMALAGVSLYARSPEELAAYLGVLATQPQVRAELAANARGMFRDDAARLLAAWARAGRVVPVPAVPGRSSRLVQLRAGSGSSAIPVGQ